MAGTLARAPLVGGTVDTVAGGDDPVVTVGEGHLSVAEGVARLGDRGDVGRRHGIALGAHTLDLEIRVVLLHLGKGLGVVGAPRGNHVRLDSPEGSKDGNHDQSHHEAFDPTGIVCSRFGSAGVKSLRHEVSPYRIVRWRSATRRYNIRITQ